MNTPHMIGHVPDVKTREPQAGRPGARSSRVQGLTTPLKRSGCIGRSASYRDAILSVVATSTQAAALDTSESNSGLTHGAGTEIERTCKVCDAVRPLGEFPLCGKNSRLRKCRRCHNAERAAANRRRRGAGEPLTSSTERERRARTRAAYGHDFVDAAPDASPAALLRELLAEDRASGWDFDRAWQENVEFVLARNVKAERESWREALEATRAAWRAAHDRAPGTGFQLTGALMDEPAGDRVSMLLAVA